MLKGFGQVEAVEMNRFAREHARTVSGVNVKAGYLPDHLPFENERFDLVCLFDVLEHVNNDHQALVEVGRLLKAEGKALITVPAYQWLYGAHDRAHHHFRRYAKTELRQKAVTAGLKPLRIGYYNMLLFPAVVPSRLVDQITDKKTVDEMTLPNRWLNRILYQIFASEAVVIPHFFFPFGTSVIAVLEPK